MDRGCIAAGYLKALGLGNYSSPHLPRLSFLKDITQRHVEKFPFASVGPRLGDELPLEVDQLYDRIVVRKRGGYCFEHNALLLAVLQDLGFDVQLFLARVIYMGDTHPGLTHQFSIVNFKDARYIVDVGFSYLGPRYPVSLCGEESHESQRIFRVSEREARVFHLQTLNDDGQFYSLYKFDLVRYGEADCQLGHFYSHKHPEAVFVNNLVASRILDGTILSLRNKHFFAIPTSTTSSTNASSTSTSTSSGSICTGGSTSCASREEIQHGAHLKLLLEKYFEIHVTEAESDKLFAQLLRE
jgi:N-hydroxyarylamine O-acetyltransferase